MTDFNGCIHAKRRTAVRTRIAGGHTAKIGVSSGLEIFARSDVLDVVVLFVSAGDEVIAAFEGFV